MRVPRSFFGLSIEYKEIHRYERAGSAFDRVVKMLRTRDGSPMLLRLGGRSADEVYWMQPASVVPHFVTDLQPRFLTRLAGLVRQDGLRVELALNLAVHSPQMAVAFARAAVKVLPPRAVAGLAIGNEPDLYKLQPNLEQERIASTLPSTPRSWTGTYSASEYGRDYRAYARKLLRALPHVPLTAPDVTFPTITWPQALIGLGRLAPRAISIHRYATAYCRRINFHNAPTVSTFLGNHSSAGLAWTLRNDIALADQHRLVLRVTEMNSVTCGGQEGVADSFATALWAPDALFEMMRAGVRGINWHIRPDLPNSPFQLTVDGIDAMPELYGLALFARMIGPDARLVRVRNSSPLGNGLKVWAVKSANGLRLLLIDKRSRAVNARVYLSGSRRPGLISRLSAPHAASTTRVTLAGQSIGTDGRWHGPRITRSIDPRGGIYRLRVPGHSAAVLDIGGA